MTGVGHRASEAPLGRPRPCAGKPWRLFATFGLAPVHDGYDPNATGSRFGRVFVVNRGMSVAEPPKDRLHANAGRRRVRSLRRVPVGKGQEIMGTMISSGVDVVTFLKEQHDQIRTAFDQVANSTGKERQSAFFALRRLLAVHETAEEEIVHPAARGKVPAGESVVEARLHEEQEAKRVLAELEKLDVDTVEFETKCAELARSVTAHAEAEERYEFEPLGERLDQPRLERMRKAVTFAESVAPTRPHAGVESATANLLIGPFASMLDRARDAISGKG